MAIWQALLAQKLTDEEKFKGTWEELKVEPVSFTADSKSDAMIIAVNKFTAQLGRPIDPQKEEIQIRPF